MKRLKEKGLCILSIVIIGSPEDQIIDYVKANGIDLEPIHVLAGIGQWILGSVTEKVLHAADKAVLVVSSSKYPK